MSKIVSATESATPASPSTGQVALYPKTDGKWYGLDSAGVETGLSASGITALTGDVAASGTGSVAATITAATVTGKAITGFVSGAGSVSATDTILTAINKLDGNVAGKQASGNYVTALTGDVTASGPGSVAATIAANAVTNAKAAQMGANTIKGNNTAGTANAADLTASQVNTVLGTITALSGDVTATGAGGSAAATIVAPADFGDGSDGAVTISGNTTLTRDMFYSSLTVNSSVILTTNGWKIFCSGTVTNNGTIRSTNVAADGSNANAQTGGALGSGSSGGSLGGAGGGGVGATGIVTAATGAQGGAGVASTGMGGNSGSTGQGGNAGANNGGAARSANSETSTPFRTLTNHLLNGTTLISGGCGAPGGNAGAGDGTNLSGGGGGGGGGGCVLMMWAKTIVNNSGASINSDGGKGGNGGNASLTGNSAGGSGGAGGGGGCVYLVYSSLSGTGTITAAGGAAGSAGTSHGTGTTPGASSAGAAGVVLKYNTTLRAWQ